MVNKNKIPFYINKEYLLKHWNYNKNPPPANFSQGSGYEAWFICDICYSEYKRAISTLKTNPNCPYCTGKLVNKINCLANKFPQVLEEWSPKNIIKPTEVSRGSGVSIIWKCKKCHSEWNTTVHNRIDKNGKMYACPYCAGTKVNHTNSLRNTHPQLLKEWDWFKNIITPDEITFNTNKKIYWICQHCDEELYLKPYHRLKAINHQLKTNKNCDHRKSISQRNKRKNSDPITITHPQFKLEWDYVKNDINPDNLTKGSHTIVFWICNICHSSYQKSVIEYLNTKIKCPFCCGRQVNETNSLENSLPIIKNIWDYEKNILQPNQFTLFSAKLAWFKCNRCYSSYENHISEISILMQNGTNGCPFCSGKLVNKTNNLMTTHPHLIKWWNKDKNKTNPKEHTHGESTKVYWKCEQNHSWKASIIKVCTNLPRCPICYSNASMKESAWLDYLCIAPENRQITIKLNNSRFIVDAYDSITNTIYLFHGDFWHGNPQIYNLNKINPVIECTFGDLYSKTINQENIFKTAGYNVVVMWEKDWNEICKVQK